MDINLDLLKWFTEILIKSLLCAQKKSASTQTGTGLIFKPDSEKKYVRTSRKLFWVQM